MKNLNDKRHFAGIWLDHSRAFLVDLTNDGSGTIRMIRSGAEGHHKATGGARGAPPYHFDGGGVEKRIQEKRKHHLHHFYQKILAQLGGAEKVLVFGPGPAKFEFRHELERKKVFSEKLAAVESADYMTKRQAVAKVREYFDIPSL